MRDIFEVEGIKGAGKSRYIDNMYKTLIPACKELETVNAGNFDTVIYVLENKNTGDITILNSGSDEIKNIKKFEKIVLKYQSAKTIYTAIRPKNVNPRLHQRMIKALCITPTDNITVVPVP